MMMWMITRGDDEDDFSKFVREYLVEKISSRENMLLIQSRYNHIS
jgi:hypothetical protein